MISNQTAKMASQFAKFTTLPDAIKCSHDIVRGDFQISDENQEGERSDLETTCKDAYNNKWYIT